MKNSLFLLFLFLFNLVFLSLVSCDSPPSSDLQSKCATYFTNLGECLSYASAKADQPTSACCSSVGEIRQKDPVCLCYIIQQVHGGSSAATSMGLQLDRLIKLPSACKLANVKMGDCPKLLNLPPSSPDNAIFGNSTTKATATPSAPSGSSSSGSSASGNIKSKGIANKNLFTPILVISAALCSFIFF